MKELRRNEFIDMLNMAELLYTGNDKCIVCDIPTLGAVTYYPKADKLNIHKGNKWEDNGYELVKNVLDVTVKLIYIKSGFRLPTFENIIYCLKILLENPTEEQKQLILGILQRTKVEYPNQEYELIEKEIQQPISVIKRESKSDEELRNEYAGLAMKGLMTIQDKGFFDSTEEMAEKCAEISFIVADAMVKRSKIK